MSWLPCDLPVHLCASLPHRAHGCQPAPGLPYALGIEKRARDAAKLGQNMPRECGLTIERARTVRT
jgi:hypothetical protein